MSGRPIDMSFYQGPEYGRSTGPAHQAHVQQRVEENQREHMKLVKEIFGTSPTQDPDRYNKLVQRVTPTPPPKTPPEGETSPYLSRAVTRARGSLTPPDPQVHTQ